MRSLLLDPEEREFHTDWDAATAEFVGSFRKSIGEHTADLRIIELVGELSLASSRFRTLWARHDVRQLQSGTTSVNHPVVGELHLHRDKLPVGDLTLVLYYPDMGSASAEKLRVLASLAATTSHTRPPATTGYQPGAENGASGHAARRRSAARCSWAPSRLRTTTARLLREQPCCECRSTGSEAFVATTTPALLHLVHETLIVLAS